MENINKGILCLTFDDQHFDSWTKALPTFAKYNAHATFFISGEISEEIFQKIKMIYDAGHSVGLHTKNHLNAPDYFQEHSAEEYWKNEIEEAYNTLKEGGIIATAFGYPNNRRTEETDAYLSKWFRRFRAGSKEVNSEYIAVSELENNRVMKGDGIGWLYKTTEKDIMENISLAAKENSCITYFSHNIEYSEPHYDMKIELLEKILSNAEEHGVKVMGFNELP